MISNLINKTQTKGGFGVDDTKNQHRKHKLIEYANGKSLEEINGTVEVPRGKGFWRTLFAYSGPGALVAVGYMDPGNWSTSITEPPIYLNDYYLDFKFDCDVTSIHGG